LRGQEARQDLGRFSKPLAAEHHAEGRGRPAEQLVAQLRDRLDVGLALPVLGLDQERKALQEKRAVDLLDLLPVDDDGGRPQHLHSLKIEGPQDQVL
jgi:hypothetical protein